MSRGQPIVYPSGGWFPLPGDAGELLQKLNDAEIRLWLMLCSRGRGRSRDVVLSNADAMRFAGIRREKDFRAARASLVGAELLTVRPTDGSRRIYTYRIESPLRPAAQPTVPTPGPVPGIDIEPIPREQLLGALSPFPSL